MKKIFFIAAGLFLFCSVYAGQFQKNETTGKYLYTGALVDGVNLDFSTWQGSDLYDPAVGENYTTATFSLQFTEKDNVGFQRWIIHPNRWIASGVPNQNALFNNGKGNNSLAESERPFIYFPAIKGGVKAIKLTGVVGWITPWYYDAGTSTWKAKASVNCNNTFGEYEFVYNDPAITMVALSYSATGFASITKLQVTSILEKPVVKDTFYVKDPTTGMYNYIGKPVDNLTLDFATWTGDSLYDAAVGSNYTSAPHTLAMVERGGVGFQKWVIYPNRWIASGVPNQNALFNNGKGNNTAAASERPYIYFPAIKGGVKAVKVTGVVGWVIPWYYNANSSTWTQMASVNCGTSLGETTIDFSSVKATLVALSTMSTSYITITKLEVVSLNDKLSDQYVKNADSGMFDYVGDAIEEKTIVDFTQMPSTKIAYNLTLGKDVHADWMIDYNKVGLYKYAYCNVSRSDITYSDQTPYTTSVYAINYQYSDCGGVSTKNDAVPTLKDQPAIYLPTVKNGIDTVIVEGWAVGTNNTMDVLVKNDGVWETPATPMPKKVIMGNKVFTCDTLVFHNRQVTDVCFARKTVAYMELTRITIIPMKEAVTIAIDENVDNTDVLEAYDGKTVDSLVVTRALKGGMYNTISLPCSTTVAQLSQAIGVDCEVLYFDNVEMAGDQLILNFVTVGNIAAGKPYLIKPQMDITEPFVLTNVLMSKVVYNISKPLDAPLARFFATLNPKQLNANTQSLLLSTDNTLYYVDHTLTMPGLRGWFYLCDAAPSGVSARVSVRSSATDCRSLFQNAHSEKYVQNGCLVIERNGIKYNAMGQKME